MWGDRRALVATAVLTLLLAAGSVLVHALPAADDSGVTAGIPDGGTLFQTKGCIGCHSIQGLVQGGNIGPDLTDLDRRAGERIVGLSAEEYVRQSITSPQAFVVPGYTGATAVMPTLPVSRGELDALVEFLLGR